VNIKLASAITIFAAFASMPGLAQQPNPPKPTKADVQKVIDGIKADKAKMAAYCEASKLDDEANAIAAKNQNDPKLATIGKQISDVNKKVGPDFEKIIYADLDEASSALLDDLAKACK
jgi:hypothetical protein